MSISKNCKESLLEIKNFEGFKRNLEKISVIKYFKGFKF